MNAIKPDQRIDDVATRLSVRDPLYLHYKPLVKDVRNFLQETSGTVVDFGCGNKPYRNYLPATVNEYIGVDADIEINQHVDVKAFLSDIPLEENLADYAICIQVLEHVPNPLDCLKEMARIIKPGGRILLCAPLTWRLHEEPHDYFRYTTHGLNHLMSAAGFRVDQIMKQGTDFSLLAVLMNQIVTRGKLRPLGCLTVPMNNWIFGLLDKNNGKNVLNVAAIATNL